MADFAKVKIGNTWLTDDGTEDGDPCMIQTDGLDLLQSQWVGAVQFSANRKPKHFGTPTNGEGATLRITAFIIDGTRHQAITAELNGLDPFDQDDTVEVIVEDEALGNFYMNCKPSLPAFLDSPETHTDEWLDQVSYLLVVTDFFTPEP